MKGGKVRSGGSSQPAKNSTGNLRAGRNGKAKDVQDEAADALEAARQEGSLMDPVNGGQGPTSRDPVDGGRGPTSRESTPEDTNAPPAAAAQARSSTNEVSKLQRKIADLEAQLAINANESKVTVDL